MLVLFFILVVKTGFWFLRLFFQVGVNRQSLQLDGVDGLLLQFHFPFQRGVEAVFDVVVCSSGEELGDFTPFVTVLFVSLDDGAIFFSGPLVLLDIRVKVVVPALAALFADSPWECLGDVAPIFCAKFLDILCEPFILFLAPGTFHHGRIENFLPSVEALDVSSLIQERGYSLPISSTKLHDELRELVVLFGVPISLSVLWILGSGKLIDVLLNRIFLRNLLCRVCVFCKP